jgi:hypothetical protein
MLNPDPQKDPPEGNQRPDVSLKHKFNYVGGAFAYKNSNSKSSILNPESFREEVLMIGYGRARKVRVAIEEADPRAGSYPDHNSQQDFRESLELIPARTLEPYKHMSEIASLEANGYKRSVSSLTKEKMRRIQHQFSQLNRYAFNQMMDIPTPDKRDFDIWYKEIPKRNQLVIVFPQTKTALTNFAQVINFDEEKNVIAIKHCSFDQGRPFVINETCIDALGNLRQIAHLGFKGESTASNSVERFDDGTVTWTITQDKFTGSAALRPNDEIVFIQNLMNEQAQLAARNFGAESVVADRWIPGFSFQACSAEENHPMQKAFKEKMRKQIGNIIDGAMIPGLIPIFLPAGY